MKKIYCIGLESELVVNSDVFFNYNEAKECVECLEKVYPKNKGMYKIKVYELKEVVLNEY